MKKYYRKPYNGYPRVKIKLGTIDIEATSEKPDELISDTLSKNLGKITRATLEIGLGLQLIKVLVPITVNYIKHRWTNSNNSQPNPAPKVQPSAEDTPYDEVADEDSKNEDSQPTVKKMTVIMNEQAQTQANLISDLISSGDICIIAGSAGQMKSILAMQLAIEISTGIESKLIPDDSETEGAEVLYYDGENDDQEIRDRYAGKEDLYLLNITRVSDTQNFKSTEQMLDHLESFVINRKNSCVVLDNLYSLMEGTNSAKATNLLKRIKEIKSKVQGSFTTIIVAHPTKEYDPTRPMELRHVAGSSNFTNLATTVLGIGPSNLGDEYKMIQVLKKRSSSKYKGKVLLEKVSEKDYLHLEYVDTKDKSDFDNFTINPSHNTGGDSTDLNNADNNHEMKIQMWTMNKKHSMSYDKIVEAYKKKGVKISRSSVGNYVKEIEAEMTSQQPSDI